MAIANNNVGGMTGGSLPDWLADWLLMQQGGIPQPSGLESITDVQENPYLGLFSGASIGDDVLQGGEDGDGWSPTFDQLNSNQLTTEGLQDVGLEALKGAISYIPGAEFVNPAIKYGGKAYDYFTDPTSGPSSIEDLGSSLKDGAISLYNDAASEINSFMANPVDTVGGALGFDMNSYEETSPFANVGETAKNVGTGLGLTGMLTGPVGLAGEAVAGMFETGALNDVLEDEMNLPGLGFFDQLYAAGTPETLRGLSLDQFDKGVMSGVVESSPWGQQTRIDYSGDDLTQKMMDDSYLRSNTMMIDGMQMPNFDIAFDVKGNPQYSPLFGPEPLKNKMGEWVANSANGLPAAFQTISNPNAQGYDPNIQGITTIEQAQQYWNTQEAIKAEQAQKAAVAAAVAAASSQAPYAVSNLSSQSTDPSYYGTYTPDASGGGGGFSGGSGGGYNDNDTSYSEGWD